MARLSTAAFVPAALALAVVLPVGQLYSWMALIAGIVMILLGFWLGGQLIGVQATTLLIFTGFWAMFRGILDIITAFQLKHINDRFDDLGEAVHEATGA